MVATAGSLTLGEGAAPTWVGAGNGTLYFDSADGQLYYQRSDTGAVVGPLSTGGGGGLVGPSNAIYVDVAGNDATGTRGDASKPFATLQAALGVAVDGDDIRMGPGLFVLPGPIPWPMALTDVSITGSGRSTTIIEGSFPGPMLAPASNMARLALQSIGFRNTDILGKVLLADGSFGFGVYMATGLRLVDVEMTVKNPGVIAMQASCVSALTMESVAVVSGGLAIITTVAKRLVDIQVTSGGSNVVVVWEDDNPSKPVGGYEIATFEGLQTANLLLGGQAFCRCAADCVVDGSVGGWGSIPLASSLSGLDPYIVFHGKAGNLLLTSGFGPTFCPLPDTPGNCLIDFSGAKFSSFAYCDVAAPAANRQTVRGNGLTAQSVVIGDGVDYYDRFAEANISGSTYSTPGTGKFCPGRWTGEVAQLAGTVTASFGFTATGAPDVVVANNDTVASGGIVANNFTPTSVDATALAAPVGKTYLAAFWHPAVV